MNIQRAIGSANATDERQIVAVVADRSTKREWQVSRFTGQEVEFTPTCRTGENVSLSMQKAIFDIANGLGRAIARSEALKAMERINACQ